jgi:hypothetical protein
VRATATEHGADIEQAPGACACRWCVDRSAQMLAKDSEANWKLPTA